MVYVVLTHKKCAFEPRYFVIFSQIDLLIHGLILD